MDEVISQRADRASTDASDKRNTRILVVDDNEALRYSIMRALQGAGYQVTEAKNGREALALAEELPDLITLDVNLPDMDGFQICRRLKTDSRTSHIPVLHVSSTFTDPESRVHGLEAADGYLAEPIERTELVATVAALLRLKSAETLARQRAEEAEKARKELAELNASLEDRIKERTVELKAANDGLRELSARLLQTRDDEQRRIARELHDSVGQLIVAIKINNTQILKEGSILPQTAVKALNENDAMLMELQQSIRTVSHLLHPPLLDEAGLSVALQWYVEEFATRSGIQVSLECSDSLGRMSGDLETAIFRVVQECLGNVHRHSASRTALVRLNMDQGLVRLEIIDQGTGISELKQKELRTHGRIGVGLRGIRERIAQFGGQLEISSSEKGTTISAVVPYDSNADSAAV